MSLNKTSRSNSISSFDLLESSSNPVNGSTNFWDLKEYSNVVRRLENSHRLCHELSTVINERAELERAYSQGLQKWAAKWEQSLAPVDYSPTSSAGLPESEASLRLALGAFFEEAKRLAVLHRECRDSLAVDLVNELRVWQKDNFHKASLPPQQLKEVRLLEQNFETAQKPWARRYKAVVSAQKEYYQASRSLRSSTLQFVNAAKDNTSTAEQIKKLEEKKSKAEKEVTRTKAEYELCLSNLVDDKERYVESMTLTFQSSQMKEKERMLFFLQLYRKMHKALDISSKAELSNLYRDLESSINAVNVQEDLNYWSQNYGSDMLLILPKFEEFDADKVIGSLSKRGRPLEGNFDSGSAILTGITASLNRHINSVSNESPGMKNVDSNSIPSAKQTTPQQPVDYHSAIIKNDGRGNPFDEDESADASTPKSVAAPASSITYMPQDSKEVLGGKAVRALYDYAAQAPDELSFQAGDILEKLEEADDMGWCKGRLNGVYGFFPAQYAANQ